MTETERELICAVVAVAFTALACFSVNRAISWELIAGPRRQRQGWVLIGLISTGVVGVCVYLAAR